jgi:type VI secretion system protein ImpK
MEHASGEEAAQRLHLRCCREIEAFQSAARALSVPALDIEASSYAVVALLDDVAIQSEGPLQAYWRSHLLMLRYFQESGAAEGFYERLAQLRDRPEQSHVLRVFYLCIMLGFRGNNLLCSSELARFELADSIRRELERGHALPTELVLSPSPPATGDQRRARAPARLRAWRVWLLLAIAIAAALLYRCLQRPHTTQSSSARELESCASHS